jgi:hypothetical protein
MPLSKILSSFRRGRNIKRKKRWEGEKEVENRCHPEETLKRRYNVSSG